MILKPNQGQNIASYRSDFGKINYDDNKYISSSVLNFVFKKMPIFGKIYYGQFNLQL